MAANVVPLGARLRQRREELGLSQAQAARELEVARTAYRLWEMEAARPAPDRWRVIAKWLGMSMTALLLAGELLEEQDALEAEAAASTAGLTSADWDDTSSASAGDFFSQERAMIADQATAGKITAEQAEGLRVVLNRMQASASTASAATWHPGRFNKRFPRTDLAPSLARAALMATAVGIPPDTLESGALLVSEMVSNSVLHTESEWIECEIILSMANLRIQVTDQSRDSIRPTSDPDSGWGMRLIAELASRWGVERLAAGKTIWVELDLTVSA
jgi:transcriptional regulator with XRE-family HTH domain/anti-sigma regulatory factor (Ser/Thr protein kinase)